MNDKYYFSAKTAAFYLASRVDQYKNSGNWPDDASPVSDDEFSLYSMSPPDGKMRSSDEKGRPCWVDLSPAATTTFEERLASAIAKRETAYKAESDPLYIEWQYDQSEEGEAKWRAKVQEIKERYPLPSEPSE